MNTYKPNKYDHPNEIPARTYEGYIWDCQKTEPKMLDAKQATAFSEWTNFPFLMEGLLYHKSEEQEYAILIRYTNQYHIYEYDLRQLPAEAKLEPYEYLAHRLPGIKQLKFQQLWLPEVDPLCCNMPVLRLKARLFTGFIPSSKS